MIIPTVDKIKNKYMFGIPLDDDYGNLYPDETMEQWIDEAVAWLEHELQIAIRPTQVTEPHDYRIDEYAAYCYVQLYRYPVISVESLRAFYGGQVIMTFPTEWIKVYGKSGQIQLVPTTGSLSQILLGQGSGVLLPLIAGRLAQMPYLFEVDYTAGFGETIVTGTAQVGGSIDRITLSADASAARNAYKGGEITILDGPAQGDVSEITFYDGTTKVAKVSPSFSTAPGEANYQIRISEVPGNICNLIGLYATCGIMNVLGDILLGAGIASQSVSIDGLSESIGTTQSAEFGAYSARVSTYVKQIKEELPKLKEYYKGIRMAII